MFTLSGNLYNVCLFKLTLMLGTRYFCYYCMFTPPTQNYRNNLLILINEKNIDVDEKIPQVDNGLK